MNAELVNLRLARKNRQREAAEEQATQNRVKFGRSKGDKKIAEFEKSKFKNELDGKKRDV